MVSNLLSAEGTPRFPFTPAEVHPSGAVPKRGNVLTTPLPVDALSLEEAENLLLAQVRYDEYLALHNLQTLFESGELEFLGR